VVRHGFVTERMAGGGRPERFGSTGENVAEAAVRALERGGHTVWVPSRLRIIFALLRHLPRPLYRRLPL